jgi:hypothetical protein
MRTLALCTLVVAGCGGSSAPPVSVEFSQAMGTPAGLGAGFASSEGVVTMAQGMITLESHTIDGDLLVMCDNPNQPITIAIDEHFLQVNYTLPDGSAWGSNLPANDVAGTVQFETVSSPYKIKIKHMQMIAATTTTMGTFFIDGSGEFSE